MFWFDKNLRMKLCEFMTIDSLVQCRKLNRDWKTTVESFMLNSLVSRCGIKSWFLKKFKSCSICDIRSWKKDLIIGYGPSHTWGIKQYFCCKKCARENAYLFKQ
jgi:hypothetical protein